MSSDLGVLNKPSVNQKRRGHRGGRRVPASVSQKVRPVSPQVADNSDSDKDDSGFSFESKVAKEKQNAIDLQKQKQDKMWAKRKEKFFNSVRKIENDQVQPIAPPSSGQFDAKPGMVTAYSFDPETRKTEDVLKDYLERRFLVDRIYRKQESPDNYVDQLAQNEPLKNFAAQFAPVETKTIQQPNIVSAPARVHVPTQPSVKKTENNTVPCLKLFVDETDQPLDKTHYDAFSKFADRLQLQVENLNQLMPAHTTNTMQRQMDLIQEQLRLFKLTIYNCVSQ